MPEIRISVEISMYPLTENYIRSIDRFLEIIHNQEGIKVVTNPMSTQVFGPSRLVFKAVQDAITEVYSQGEKAPFVLKVLNGDVSGMEIKNYQLD